MGADLFFSDDVCVGNLKETKDTNVKLTPNRQDLDTLDMFTYFSFFFIYTIQHSTVYDLDMAL